MIFLREDEEAFNRRIEEATRHREEAELIMKYYYMIQNTTRIPRFEMSDEQKTRISYHISSFNPLTTNIKERKFRDPSEFLAREALDRYEIPVTKRSICDPSTAVEDIHRDFLKSKYNLQTFGALFKELDDDYTKAHKQIFFD